MPSQPGTAKRGKMVTRSSFSPSGLSPRLFKSFPELSAPYFTAKDIFLGVRSNKEVGAFRGCRDGNRDRGRRGTRIDFAME